MKPVAHDHLLFFLGDTNGHLGEMTSTSVGLHGGNRENGPGHEFHNWMLEHTLFAPSTFADTHRGEQGENNTIPTVPLTVNRIRAFTMLRCPMNWTDNRLPLGLLTTLIYAVHVLITLWCFANWPIDIYHFEEADDNYTTTTASNQPRVTHTAAADH